MAAQPPAAAETTPPVNSNGSSSANSATKPRKAKPRRGPKLRVERKGRTSKPFPNCSFQDAMELAEIIQRSGVENRMRRLTLFDQLQKSPDSGPSRMLVINSGRYGLTSGGYHADYLELTEQGRLAVDPDVDVRTRVKARFALAIENVGPFKHLYEKLGGNKLPAQAVLYDLLREIGVAEDQLAECVDIFIVNAKFLGLLKTVAGAERVLKLDHAIEELPPSLASGDTDNRPISKPSGTPLISVTTDWQQVCFYITPIGPDDSEHRKHSDLFLNCIVEPAIRESGLKVIRADQIGKPGMIGAQIIDHVIKARLVIADLSFHNPNVFYELSLRHACGLPTVQIIRSADQMPFDLHQFRTIQIDTTDIYSLVPKLEVYKAEIATQVRRVLENSESIDNPITTFCPGLKISLPQKPVAGPETQRAVM